MVKLSTSKVEEIKDDTIEVQTENTITKKQFQVLVDNMIIMQQSLMILIQQNNNIVQNTLALPVVDTILYSPYNDKQKVDIIYQKADIIYPKADIILTAQLQQSPKINDHILQNLYNNISQYNSDKETQKLYDFIDKVKSYLIITKLNMDIELEIIIVKLIRTASLW